MKYRVPVFYRREQVAPAFDSISPSAQKPKLVVDAWVERNYPIEIVSYKPFSAEDIIVAHDPDYVNSVLSLQEENGFGNKLGSVAESLKYTNASFYYAARHALIRGGVACSPTSGFHHAHYGAGGGFCTFNGLMITAKNLVQKYNVKVGILDLDAHYGDGTEHIIKKLKLDDKITHFTFGDLGLHKREGDRFVQNILPDVMNLMSRSKVDIILYQAGADSYIDDPLGAGVLTLEQLRERDRIVFTKAKEFDIPVVWNLAGGYSNPVQKVIDIHNITMEECMKVYVNSDT